MEVKSPELTAEFICKTGMRIAGDLCIYTNHNTITEIIPNRQKNIKIDNGTAGSDDIPPKIENQKNVYIGENGEPVVPEGEVEKWEIM